MPSEIEFSLVSMALCMSIHIGYILILIKSNPKAWNKQPINLMILISEGFKFVCSLAAMVGITILSVGMEASRQPGTSYMGNGSFCQTYLLLGMLGGFWIIIEGAGNAKNNISILKESRKTSTYIPFPAISTYRLLIFKNSRIVATLGKWCTMWVIHLIGCLVSLVIIETVRQNVKPKHTLLYNCLSEYPQDYVPIVTFPLRYVVPICIFLTLVEVSIYCNIIYDLCAHDKLMKLVMRDEDFKRRQRKNAVCLFAHMCQFLLKFSFLLITAICVKHFNFTFMLAPGLSVFFLTALTSKLHIAMSSALQTDISKIFTKAKTVISAL